MSGPGRAIVPATPVHAVMLAIIHASAFPEDEAWGPEAIALSLELPGAFGLFSAGAGMILARAAGGEAEVLTLAVAEPARRQGVAGTLLDAAMAEAAARGAVAMFLEVSTRNEAARALYARAGFVEVGRRARYYADGADALVLRSPLSSPGATAAG
ncbi:MAG TPA: GNAT family N-acetyltransferase [Acetobacteraceae bacterium]|nr:GNAT family N-acetyltransferase [Acetobacteraceae bacterium]